MCVSTHVCVVLVTAIGGNRGSGSATEARTSQKHQQMAHICFWIWIRRGLLTGKIHTQYQLHPNKRVFLFLRLGITHRKMSDIQREQQADTSETWRRKKSWTRSSSSSGCACNKHNRARAMVSETASYKPLLGLPINKVRKKSSTLSALHRWEE